MFRVNLLGKVGYFRSEGEVLDFAVNQFEKVPFDTILKDSNSNIERVKSDFLHLRAFNSQKLVGRRKMIYKNGLGIMSANFFMGFRLRLRALGKKSVEENLREEKAQKRIVHKIITLGGKRDIRLSDFLTMTYLTSGGQRLGQFMPVVAKAVYETFCPEQNANILDISAGFGGRLVGAMSSKYQYSYTGVDPSTEAIKGLKQLIGFLGVDKRARVVGLPFEDSDKELKDNSFDLCFTSPPYFKKEIYSDEKTQSCHRYEDIEGWRKGFLEKSFAIVHKKLKEGKYMLINIADVKIKGKVYPLESLTIDTGKKVGFNYKGYKVMEMSKIPGLKRKYKSEKIFIFQKAIAEK